MGTINPHPDVPDVDVLATFAPGADFIEQPLVEANERYIRGKALLRAARHIDAS